MLFFKPWRIWTAKVFFKHQPKSDERILLVAVFRCFPQLQPATCAFLQCGLSHKPHLTKLQWLSLNHQLGTLKLQSLSFWRSQQLLSYFSAYRRGCLHASFCFPNLPLLVQEYTGDKPAMVLRQDVMNTIALHLAYACKKIAFFSLRLYLLPVLVTVIR